MGDASRGHGYKILGPPLYQDADPRPHPAARARAAAAARPSTCSFANTTEARLVTVLVAVTGGADVAHLGDQQHRHRDRQLVHPRAELADVRVRRSTARLV